MLLHVIVSLIFVPCVLNLREGDTCIMDNVEGECVSIYKCLGTLIDQNEKNYALVCSYQGEVPIICCTDCDRVNDTRNYIWDQNIGFWEKTGIKARDKCLEYVHTLDYPCKRRLRYKRKLNTEKRCYEFVYEYAMDTYLQDFIDVAGGIAAKRNEFPHMALLGYGEDFEEGFYSWLCSGTVISDRFVLTAGHCISVPELGAVKVVATGILKRSDPIKLWKMNNVKRIIPHPDYKPPKKYNDIALLETDTPIVFGTSVLPACLHTEGDPDTLASATGWGALGRNKELADELQVVYLNLFQDVECTRAYPPHRLMKKGYDSNTQLCYGDFYEIRDTCAGDSGGPLQTTSGSWCLFTVLGVTSFGHKCGIRPMNPGIYTRVKYYVPWIESIVWP